MSHSKETELAIANVAIKVSSLSENMPKLGDTIDLPLEPTPEQERMYGYGFQLAILLANSIFGKELGLEDEFKKVIKKKLG